MITLRSSVQHYLDNQHRHPRGLVGRLIGERMRRQHTPETVWSVDLLAIAPSDRVLEIGFGSGQALSRILARVPDGHVTGIDLSTAMISAARRRNRAAIAERRLALLQGDLASLPFGERRFDRILSIHTLYFWPDQTAICERLIGMLAPGGRLVVTFASAATQPDGHREYWPIHAQAEALIATLRRERRSAHLAVGPDSRQFNNVAIVVDQR